MLPAFQFPQNSQAGDEPATTIPMLSAPSCFTGFAANGLGLSTSAYCMYVLFLPKLTPSIIERTMHFTQLENKSLFKLA
jgi:hypothetical protein